MGVLDGDFGGPHLVDDDDFTDGPPAPDNWPYEGAAENLGTIVPVLPASPHNLEPPDEDDRFNPSSLLDIPALPAEIQIDPSTWNGAGAWVDTYVNYARSISPMTPDLFHESAALFLAALVIARRLVLKMAFDDIYPNLYILWVAITTFFRKSTALNISRNISREVTPHLLAAQDTTPEAFLSDLAGKEPPFFEKLSPEEQEAWKLERDFAGQRGWILDELSGLLSSAGRDYNQGLTEALLRFYDNDPLYTRSTRGQGRVTVYDSYLSILGASTPAAMAMHLSAERLWNMGFWPRFAILTPDSERPAWREPVETARPAKITDDLKKLYNRLPRRTWPERPQPITVGFAHGVYAVWSKYNKALSYDLLTAPDVDARLHGAYGRLPTQALKIATILAAMDWKSGNAPVIEHPHMARAISIAETWRASAHRSIANAGDSETSRLQQRILAQVTKREPKGATIRDLYQNMKDKRISEIEACVFEMTRAGYLEEKKPEMGNRGRPTSRYVTAKE